MVLVTVHAPDARTHLEALRDAIPPSLPMYDYGAVPGMKNSSGTTNPGAAPNIYGLWQIERTTLDNGLMIRHSRRTGWRLSLRAVGKTTANNCRIALGHLLALENAALVIDDHETTPLRIESADDAAPDDGWYSALVRITYTL